MIRLWTVAAVMLYSQGLKEPAQHAEPLCGPRAEIETKLTMEFGETRMWSGVVSGGQLLAELWINKQETSWTLTLTGTDLRTCLASVGRGSYLYPSGVYQ